MDIEALKFELVLDEGLETKPYTCSAGKITIGVGRNLEDLGISDDEAEYLLDNDIERVFEELDVNIAWWRTLPEPRARALMNMCFNLGWPRLSSFKKMLAALQVKDYETAAREALDSRWAQQVGERAQRIAHMIKGG